MRTVAFLDLEKIHTQISEELSHAIKCVLEHDLYILGEAVTSFETAFASYTSASYCVGVGNGFDALVLSLRSLGVGPGDEVLVPSHTFVATWMAVSAVGARPIPIATEPDGYNMDLSMVEEQFTNKTRVVIPVHLYGCLVDVKRLARICKPHNVRILEDAAQAHGATRAGDPPGRYSDLVAWSFYPGKNLGALGDAGAVSTNDPELAAKIRLLRNYGSTRKYEHEILGVNSRLDSFQAAALSVKLRYLDSWNARRRRQAGLYMEILQNLPINLPSTMHLAESSWHLFVVGINDRDHVRTQLQLKGIETGIHYPIPPHRQPPFVQSSMAYRQQTSRADELASSVLSLPIGPHLTDGDIELVCRALYLSLQ